MPRIHDGKKYSPRCSRRNMVTRPLQRVNFDLVISCLVSLEEYHSASLFVDDYTVLLWHCRLKTKDEINSNNWRGKEMDGYPRAIYPLLVVINNARENSQLKCLTISHQCRPKIITALGMSSTGGMKMDCQNLVSNQFVSLPEAEWPSQAKEVTANTGSVQRHTDYCRAWMHLNKAQC